jgi:TonB-dependent SusC/RagA subfamily outer membrane receptor
MHVPSAVRRTRRTLFIALVVGATASMPRAHASAQGTRDVDSASVAPGVRVSARLRGASSAVVDSNDVHRAAALTLSELLQARAASVNVSMSGGSLLDGGQLLVRGPSSIRTEGTPMVIVDGMRMIEDENDPVSTTTRLDDIAIDDIERIEVLRGPSAAALYGAGASSGVIVVTTKRGSAGALRGHVRAVAEGSQDAGHYIDRIRRRPVGSTTNYSCTLSAQAAGACVPGPIEQWNPLTEGSVFRAGTGAAAAFDVSGGTRTSDARLSASVRRANGIASGDKIARLASRLNATHRLTERIDVTGRVAYTNDQTSGSNVGEVIDDAAFVSVGATPLPSFEKWAEFMLGAPAIDGRLDHFTAGGELTARATHWLTLRAAVSDDRVNEGAERLIRVAPFVSNDPNTVYLQPAPDDQQHVRMSLENEQRAMRATGELTLPVPGSLPASALLIVGVEHERRDRTWRSAEGYGPYDFSSLTRETWATNPAQFILGRLVVADGLAIAAGARRENDSATDPKWTVYPMADVAIRPPARIVGGELRLRAAVGKSAQRPAMSSGIVRLPSPERMTEREGGVDLEWGTRGALSATYYDRTISGVLTGQQLPSSPGFVIVPTIDIASHGMEVDASAAVVRRGALRWTLRGIVATNTNRVVGTGATGSGQRLVAGYPVGVAQRVRYTVDDANGNGVVDPGEASYTGGYDLFGGSTPTFTLALHSELRIGRHLSLTGVIDRRSGAWSTSSYAAARCEQPEFSCREDQDPSSSLAEQAGTRIDAFDASFTRLRELSVRWTMEPRVARLVGGGPVQIVLSGRNLATWTQWPGLDPEINSLGRGAITRDDASAVPLPRRVMLGLEVGY